MADIIKFPGAFRVPVVPDELYDGEETCWLASSPDDPTCDCPECIAHRSDLEPIAPAQSQTPKDPT